MALSNAYNSNAGCLIMLHCIPGAIKMLLANILLCILIQITKKQNELKPYIYTPKS